MQHASSTESGRGAARAATRFHAVSTRTPVRRRDLCGGNVTRSSELHTALESFQLAAAETARAHADAEARDSIELTSGDDHGACHKAALPAVLGRVTSTARTLHCALAAPSGAVTEEGAAGWLDGAAGVPVVVFHAVLDALLAPREVATTGEVCVESNDSATQTFLCVLCRLNAACVCADEANLGGPLRTVDSLSPSTMSARSAMGRSLDLLLWAVEHACSDQAEGARAHTAAAAGGDRDDGAHPCDSPWLSLLRRTDALLGFLHAALTPATDASELYACGVAARLGALQVLERLLAASYADHHGPHATGLPTKGRGDRGTERLERSAALAAQLTADDVLCAVAAQLQASIPVLEEIHPASGFSHMLLYDCLRHGSALARTPAAVANGGVSGGAATRQSGAPYVAAGGGGKGLLDGTRQAQSPLELYNCAMTFLRHAVEYRTVTSGWVCAGNSGGGPAALPLPAWVAVVSVLERALLEGESALADPVAEAAAPDGATGTAPSSTDPAPPGATAAAAIAAAATSATADPAASASATTPPPLTTAGVFTGAHQPYSTDPTPCGSPVLNPNPPAAAGAAANVTAQPAATSGESVTGAPQACDGGGAGFHALEFPHAPPLVPDEGCSNPDDTDSGHHRGRGTDRCSAMLERSVPSADATFNGMTDAETASALGDAATSLARTRSAAVARSTTNTHTISIATATAAASAAAGGTAATDGGEKTLAPSLSEAADAPVRVSSVAATIATPLPAASGPLSTSHASCQTQHQQKHHTHQHHRHHHRVPSSATTASPAAPQALSVCSKGSLSVPRPRTSTSGGAASPSAAAAATPAAPTLASSATLLRWRHPSHPRLTSDALALLTDLTSASARTLTSMTTLVDADVLGVLRGMLECPSFALQQRVLAILESVFAFWETLTAQSPETLVLPDSTSSYSSAVAPVVTAAVLFREPHDAPFGSWPAGGVPQATGATLSALATPSIQPPSSPCVPAALRAFLQAFTTFLGWDAEGWEVTHANYTRRALQMLMHVLQHAKAGPSNSGSVGAAARRRPQRTTQALLHIVTFLLENGVIAHIWRCLATDATQIPGLLCGTASPPSPSSSGPSSGSSSSRVASGAGRYSAPVWGYSSFLFGTPGTLSLAILSDAQCTAMELLGALAEAVSWAAVGSVEANSWRPTAAATAVVPSVGTYMAFTEALFTHLTACANCLRRCTYTRSSSRPATPAELKALSRLLLTLRVLFASMGAGVGSRTAASTAAADRRETWRQCITDSRVLDVLASVGTAAELVGCSLPRLCMFTLRTFLDHAIVLAPPSPLLRLLPPREAAAEVALHALVRQPTPQPPVAGTATVWGGSAVRESLLVTLLSRMQRRCAGQSAEVSLPLRLEVLALLVDIVTEAVAATQHAAVLGSTASFAGVAATVAAGIPLRNAVERAAEATRMTQRFVANIIDCRVWSGTAQELRYLGPDNTALVKETLRLLCAATQLVGATGQLWTTTSAVAAAAALAYATDTRARGTDESRCTSVGNDGAATRPYTLGQLTATTLAAESASLVFGFHIVTMDLPLTLAGLVNGTRWQSTTPKPTSTAAATGAAAAVAVTGIRGAQSGRSTGPTSTSSATSSSQPTSPSSRVVVRMTPCPPPLAQPAPAAAIHEFYDEDRCETFQVAACALAELLRCLRCLQVLVLRAPVSPALTASASNAIAAAAAAPGSTPSLQWRSSGSASASPAIAGGTELALLLPPSHAHDGTPAVGGAARWRSIAAAAVAATMASAVPERRGEVAPVNGSDLGGGHAGEPSHHQLQQHDVVLVSGPSGSTAGIVTTTVYRGVVGREGGTAAQVAGALAVDGATVASTPGAPSSPASASSPALGTPSGPGGAEREEENANNWRQCEPRWRRRVVCFKTAHTDAVHALELDMLDRFLFVQARHDSTKEPHPARATSVVSSAGAAAAAAAAMTLLGGEEGEATVLSRDNELECAITAVRFLASEKKRLHNSL